LINKFPFEFISFFENPLSASVLSTFFFVVFFSKSELKFLASLEVFHLNFLKDFQEKRASKNLFIKFSCFTHQANLWISEAKLPLSLLNDEGIL